MNEAIKCEGCCHKTDNPDEFCYMFRTEQPGNFCGQNTMHREFLTAFPILEATLTALAF